MIGGAGVQQQNGGLGVDGNGANGAATPGAVDGISEESRKVLNWVSELMDSNRRESALMELSKKREQVPELALIIWHSFGRFYSTGGNFGHDANMFDSG